MKTLRGGRIEPRMIIEDAQIQKQERKRLGHKLCLKLDIPTEAKMSWCSPTRGGENGMVTHCGLHRTQLSADPGPVNKQTNCTRPICQPRACKQTNGAIRVVILLKSPIFHLNGIRENEKSGVTFHVLLQTTLNEHTFNNSCFLGV